MTTAQSPRVVPEDDAAISSAVQALLAQRGEAVSDLAYHTRISVASLYRKLGGQAAWKAADIGAVARHYGLRPGDLFLGIGVVSSRPFAGEGDGPDGDGGVQVRHQGLEPRTRWFGGATVLTLPQAA